ncbi:MAG: hypothetical protein IKC40_03870 [Oscillospiraceae bacterium]|nr:hypothetical protein [Oscillospiraceae bacterium]
MNFKKIMAAVAAMSLVACAAAIPASASAEGATVEIQQVTLTLDELKAMNYEVPINIVLTENAGINAFAFGVGVEEGCSFTVDMDVQEVMMAVEAAKSSDAEFAWVNGANARTYKKSDMIICGIVVKVPETAAAGDQFDITYAAQDQEGKKHIWGDTTTKADYVAAGSADAVDGWIKITGVPTTEATTTTEETTTTTESETTTTTESSETTTTTTTTGTGTATSTTPGTGSPATGTTDVLPIVGVAAAAAILGGVAIVAKKKED